MVAVPEKFWNAIIAFLKAGKDGEIILKIHKGNIFKVDVTEHLGI